MIMPYRIASAFGYILSLGGSAVMLAYLHLRAIPHCQDLDAFGSRSGVCALSPPVLFLFNAFFLILIAFSAYRLLTAFPKRVEPDEGELSETFPGDAAARLSGREG